MPHLPTHCLSRRLARAFTDAESKSGECHGAHVQPLGDQSFKLVRHPGLGTELQLDALALGLLAFIADPGGLLGCELVANLVARHAYNNACAVSNMNTSFATTSHNPAETEHCLPDVDAMSNK